MGRDGLRSECILLYDLEKDRKKLHQLFNCPFRLGDSDAETRKQKIIERKNNEMAMQEEINRLLELQLQQGGHLELEDQQLLEDLMEITATTAERRHVINERRKEKKEELEEMRKFCNDKQQCRRYMLLKFIDDPNIRNFDRDRDCNKMCDNCQDRDNSGEGDNGGNQPPFQDDNFSQHSSVSNPSPFTGRLTFE